MLRDKRDTDFDRRVRDSSYATLAWALTGLAVLGLLWTVYGLGAAAIALVACFCTAASLIFADLRASLVDGEDR